MLFPAVPEFALFRRGAMLISEQTEDVSSRLIAVRDTERKLMDCARSRRAIAPLKSRSKAERVWYFAT
jgi:hypothetical protein